MIQLMLFWFVATLGAVRQLPSGRWLAVVKIGRLYGGSKAFRTQREAKSWEVQRKADLRGGVDPVAGKATLSKLIPAWLTERDGTVSAKTLRADADLMRLLPAWFLALRTDQVTDGLVDQLQTELSKTLGYPTLVRLRASLSSFMSHCVRRKVIPTNPVLAVRRPNRLDEATDMRPLTEAEVEEVAAAIAPLSQCASTTVLLLAWLGLRWGEARSVRVGDLVRVPSPALIIRRSHSEGYSEKTTKGRRVRRVPIADRILPLVERLAEGKATDDYLFTTASGGQLHQGTFRRVSRWTTTARGRRIHDLRHTAACLWLTRGVDLATVQAWMGHDDARTTNLYLHYLGTDADLAALDRLNAAAGANRGQVNAEGGPAA